jgi:hypothetical protein
MIELQAMVRFWVDQEVTAATADEGDCARGKYRRSVHCHFSVVLSSDNFPPLDCGPNTYTSILHPEKKI